MTSRTAPSKTRSLPPSSLIMAGLTLFSLTVACSRQGSELATATSALSTEEAATPMDRAAITQAERVIVEVSNDRYQDNAAIINYRLTLEPKLSHPSGADTPTTEFLTHGQFNVNLTLIERTQDDPADKKTILSEHSLTASIENGALNLDFPLTVTRMPHRTAVLELAYRLTPINAPNWVTADEGILQLPGLKSGGILPVRRPPEGVSSYLAQAKPDTAPVAAVQCSDGNRDVGYYLATVTAENAGIVSRTPNENVPAAVLANFTVCMNRSLDHDAVADQPFEIRWADQSTPNSKRLLTSDANGCVHWGENVTFDYFSAERWQERTLLVESKAFPFRNVSRTFPLSLNPWQSGDSFYWNCRRGDKPTFKTEPARLELFDVSYSFVGRDLEVDPNLNLKLKRRYQLTMTPKIRRSSGYSGMPSYESILDGRYQLRAILLSPNQDEAFAHVQNADARTILKNFTYLSSFEREIQARNGQIVEIVELPVDFAEMPLLASRNLLLIQLSPLGSSDLISQPFYTPLLTMTEYGIMGLAPSMNTPPPPPQTAETGSPITLDLASLIELGKTAKTQRIGQTNTIETFRLALNLRQPEMPELLNAGITASVLNSLLTSPRSNLENLKKICPLLENSQPSALSLLPAAPVRSLRSQAPLTPASPASVSCLRDPLGTLVTLKTRHVEAVTGAPRIVDSTYKVLSVNAGFSIHQDQTQSNSNGTNDNHGMREGVHGGVGFNFFGFINAGADTGWSRGHDWFHSSSAAESRSAGSTLGSSSSRNFAVEELRVALTATERECLSVRKKNETSGVLICETLPQQITDQTESFYLITEQAGDSPIALRDNKSVMNRPWIKAVRGRSAFEALRKVLEDRNRTIVLDVDHPEHSAIDRVDDLFNHFADTAPRYSDGAFPSVIY